MKITRGICAAQKTLQGSNSFNDLAISVFCGLFLFIPSLSQANNLTSFSPETENQWSVSRYLLESNNPALNEIISLLSNDRELEVFLDQFSAATYATQQMSLLYSGQQFDYQIIDRIDRTRNCHLDKDGNEINSDGQFELCKSEIFWTALYAGQNRIRKSDVSGMNNNIYGISFGVDLLQINGMQFGGAFGYVKMNDNSLGFEKARSTGGLFQFGVYGWEDIDNWRLGGAFTYGRTEEVNTFRLVQSPFGSQKIGSSYYSTLISADGRLSYRYDTHGFTIQPLIGGLYQAVQEFGVTEDKVPDFGLNIEMNSLKSFRTQLGTRIEFFSLPDIAPLLFVAWEHEYAQERAGFMATIADLPGEFQVFGPQIGPNALVIEAGISFINHKNWELALLYEGRFAGGFSANIGKMQLGFF